MQHSASTEQKPWVWGVRQLARKRPDTGARLRLNIAQTILFESGEPVLWVFTAQSGEVMRRNTNRLRSDLVRDTLSGRRVEDESGNVIPRAIDVDSGPRYVAAPRRGNKEAPSLKATVISEVELTRALATEEKMTVVAMQAYVQGGASHTGTRYRCQATLEGGPHAQQRRLAVGVMKLCYLGTPVGGKQAPHPRSASGGAEVGPAFLLKSHMTSFNGELTHATRGLVAHIEGVARLRVVRLVADFVRNASGVPVLVSLPELRTAPVDKLKPCRPSSAAPALARSSSEAGVQPACSASGLSRPASAAAIFIGDGRAYDTHGNGVITAGGRPKPWLRLHIPLSRHAEVQRRAMTEDGAAECAGDFCVGKSDSDGPEGDFPAAPALHPPQTPPRERSAVDYMVPYKSVLMARVEREVPHVSGGVDGRTRLLESGQPGSCHPADPQKPHPFEFYSGVWVCHHCYVAYCRLDAIRHQTLPKELQPPVGRSEPTKTSKPTRDKPEREACINGERTLGLIPRRTAVRTERLTVDERQLSFRLDGRRRVKQMLQSLEAQAAQVGTVTGVRSKKYDAAPSTRLGGYAAGLSNDWKPPLSPGELGRGHGLNFHLAESRSGSATLHH